MLLPKPRMATITFICHHHHHQCAQPLPVLPPTPPPPLITCLLSTTVSPCFLLLCTLVMGDWLPSSECDRRVSCVIILRSLRSGMPRGRGPVELLTIGWCRSDFSHIDVVSCKLFWEGQHFIIISVEGHICLKWEVTCTSPSLSKVLKVMYCILHSVHPRFVLY